MNMPTVAALVGTALLVVVLIFGSGGPEPEVARVPVDQAAVAAATADARATLREFLHIKQNPPGGADQFAIKVMISDENGVEQFWLSPFGRTETGDFAGVINNEPTVVRSVSKGQVFDFKEADVTDWKYVWNGQIHGNRSLRAILPTLTRSEIANHKAKLAPLS